MWPVTGDTQRTIYLVDDDSSIRLAMTRLLKSAGYAVEVFAMAEAFLESAFVEKNTLLIIDIHLPGLNGLELQEKLQRDGIAIPVIFITAYDSGEKSERAKSQGAAAYFKKPVDAEALFNAIECAMSSPES